MDLKICDDNGNEVPVGQKGEIVIRGGNVMYTGKNEAVHYIYPLMTISPLLTNRNFICHCRHIF